MNELELTMNEYESDNRYICFNPKTNLQIFKHIIRNEDLEDCFINVSVKIKLEEIIEKVSWYLEWINNCEKELKAFYENKLNEKVGQEWFSKIEVYSANITFNSVEDYGATISCGDTIFLDHILEFDFEKENVVDVRLNG